MKNKFFIPATTMLSGIFVWGAYLFLRALHLLGSGSGDLSQRLGATASIAAGVLIYFSAIRCRAVGGPLVGNIIRTVLLFAMSAVSAWKIGTVAAGILAAAATFTGGVVVGSLREKKV